MRAQRKGPAALGLGRSRHANRAAALLVAPFVIVYGALFLYPSAQMVLLSLTDGQLIVPGEWVGLANYAELLSDRRLGTAILNTTWFVVMTVVPNTLISLMLALMVFRLGGALQAIVLAVFFLPYVLPVTTVVSIWLAIAAIGYGPLGGLVEWISGRPVGFARTPALVLPAAAIGTIWWTAGFNVLLFLGGLRTIPKELWEAARIDGAGRVTQFREITWPLIWPVTALVATIQLIMQMKVFDQVYLLVQGGRVDATMVMVQYIYTLAFQRNQGGYAATVAVTLFVFVAAVSVLQFQLLRMRGAR